MSTNQEDRPISQLHAYRRLQQFCVSIGLLVFLVLSIIASPIVALLYFSAGQPAQNIARSENVDATSAQIHANPVLLTISNDLEPGSPPLHTLLANVPQVNSAPRLVTTNYQEDRAVREAILAQVTQWETVLYPQRLRYVASNQLQVYLGHPTQSLSTTRELLARQSERTVLTARIVLGLWNSRRDDPRLARNGSVVIRADEILAWRGIQKHQRTAYAGATKRFSDGYQWKHKQQVAQDMALLQQYYVRGYHTLVIEGKKTRLPVDDPYLRIIPLNGIMSTKEAVDGYLVAPGNWIDDYESSQHSFLVAVERKIFQLNPQNEQLALRMALYLSEQWRQQARSGDYKEPVLMAQLLSASMISVDKANLTSRFVPRIEAALQKLYEQGVLGAAPVCLSCVDKTQAQWGKEWLASYWHIVPPLVG